MATAPALIRSVLTTLACLLLPACVVLPATIETYDSECRTVSHHMVLQQVQIAEINHCRNQECTMMIVAGAATEAASAIVSGSIVIIGNAAYWIERRAACQGPVVVTPAGPPVIAPGAPPAPVAVPN